MKLEINSFQSQIIRAIWKIPLMMATLLQVSCTADQNNCLELYDLLNGSGVLNFHITFNVTEPSETEVEAKYFPEAIIQERVFAQRGSYYKLIWKFVDESFDEVAFNNYTTNFDPADLQYYDVQSAEFEPKGPLQKENLANLGEEAVLFKRDNFSSGERPVPFQPEVSSILVIRQNAYLIIIGNHMDFEDQLVGDGEELVGLLIKNSTRCKPG